MLTAALSFVVQIDRVEDALQSELCGRVEHVLSGRSSLFASLAELGAFLRCFESQPKESEI